MIRLDPPFRLPQNLTISLIERDRYHHPDRAARQANRNRRCAMYYLAAYSRYTPPPIPPKAIQQNRLALDQPALWPYNPPKPPPQHYQPHRIPSGLNNSMIGPKSPYVMADEYGRFLDLFA